MYRNTAVRVANWSEDVELRAEKMKDFLHRKEHGLLLVHHVASRMSAGLAQVGLTFSKDGFLCFGDHVMLYSTQTEGVLSVDVCDDARAADAIFPVTTSTLTETHVARNTFVLTPYERAARGDPLRFGQPFRLAMNPALCEQPLYLHSQAVTPFASSKVTRKQEVLMHPTTAYDSVWMVQYRDPGLRFEMEGQPVPANAEVVILHAQTRQALSSDRHRIFNDFGHEYEVCAHTQLDVAKAHTMYSELMGRSTTDTPARKENTPNVWAFLTATAPEQDPLSAGGAADSKAHAGAESKASTGAAAAEPRVDAPDGSTKDYPSPHASARPTSGAGHAARRTGHSVTWADGATDSAPELLQSSGAPAAAMARRS